MTAAPAQGSLGCVTGRFQPVHDDHLRLVRIALAAHERVIVAITGPDPGSLRPEPQSGHRHLPGANPFTYWERAELLTAALGADPRVAIVPFDLARPAHWAGYAPLEAVQYVGRQGPWEAEKARRLAAAGYRVVEVAPGRGPRRTATAIRAVIRAGGPWEEMVPAATIAPLRAILAARAAAGVAPP